MNEEFKKTYEFRALRSGSYDDGFFFAVPVDDFEAIDGEWDEWDLDRNNKGLLKLHPEHLLPKSDRHPDPQAYHYKITIEATPIDAMPPIPARVMEVANKAFVFRNDEGRILDMIDAIENE